MQSELGKLQQEFNGQKAAERSFLMGFALLGFGVGNIWLGIDYIEGVEIAQKIFGWFLLGSGPFLGFGAVLAFRRGVQERWTSLQLYDQGFLVTQSEQTHKFVWDQISQVKEIITRKGGYKHWWVEVIRNDEERFMFGEGLFDDANELRDVLQQQTAAHDVPWQTHDENPA